MNRHQRRSLEQQSKKIVNQPKPKAVTSLLDVMVDGSEYESIIRNSAVDLDIVGEMRRAISDIEAARGKPLICYLANVVNPKIKARIAIDNTDELPFTELVSKVADSIEEVDVLIVTPGGSAQQVAKFVDRLRPKFKKVSFILPNMAMSAGTIFVMSGDEIIMHSAAHIGPIDPQVIGKDGQYVPAQALLTLINTIQIRGDQLMKNGAKPLWTDLQILRQIDGKEIGNAINASDYSIELVENYLYQYKFQSWVKHSNGTDVTEQERRLRSKEIATLLCDHSVWKTHSRGITREAAWNVCKLKIVHSESVPNLDRAVRRFWALTYWMFENSPVYKMFISKDYCIFRKDGSLINKT